MRSYQQIAELRDLTETLTWREPPCLHKMALIELDEATIRQIAAGEVVERPASVVKELVENSLDAEATRLDVAIDCGGKDRIRVADNGVGMRHDDVQLAVQKHTTSKITDISDLEAGLSSLGFRGEALYAIGAVSAMTITTKPDGGDRATALDIQNGEIADISPAGRPAGTTVEVTDLFDETPARRKFLKADATEFDHVNQIVTRYALANPDVAISLIHDDTEVFATTGQGDLQGALLSVYGRDVAESMIELPEGDMVTGYVSHPETTRSTRDYLSTYVNGRYVRSNTLRRAIVDAYQHQLSSSRYPFAVLFLEVDPASIDVNVHPRKLEVRFDDDQTVTETVRTTVQDTLLDHGLIRSTAPRGRSAPAETELTPASSDDDQAPPAANEVAPSKSEEANTEMEPDSQPQVPDERATVAEDPDGSAAGGASSVDAAGNAASTSPAQPPDGDSSGDRSDSIQDADSRPASPDDTATEESFTAEPIAESHPSRRFRSAGTQLTLGEDTGAEETTFDRLPPMRILAQVHDTYILGETADGLVLIDQHAADERVNFERLQERLAGERATQQLAEPVTLELTGREAAVFPAYTDVLAELGFHAEQADERTLEVTAVPAVFDQTLDPELLRDVLVEYLQRETTGDTSVDVRTDAVLGDLACYPSITGNTSLTEGSVRELLDSLDGCENPYACPHGRPVVIEISEQELDDRFERDYPGHTR